MQFSIPIIINKEGTMPVKIEILKLKMAMRPSVNTTLIATTSNEAKTDLNERKSPMSTTTETITESMINK